MSSKSPSVRVTDTHHQAIVTRYLGPTNYRPSRIVARCGAKRIVLSWDHALGVNENHDRACIALASKLGWTGAYASGGHPDGTGNVYVCIRRGVRS